MKDRENWVGLLTHFHLETALSGYIAAYPHHLEDGMLPHSNESIRERIFGDKSRLDVLLLDQNKVPVIVECKQGKPAIEHLKQIRGYMAKLRKEKGGPVRGILVHGGSRKLAKNVAVEARRDPRVEIVKYSLSVEFAGCNY